MGFGFLRLPRLDGQDETSVDLPQVCAMVDEFLARGGRYFDTAYTYLEGMSERAICECLVQRHPRESFLLADKLPTWKLKEPADCERYFAQMLKRCGVEYFDVLLIHGLNAENYQTALQCGAFDFVRDMQRQGRARKIGFSFHDTPEMLETILQQQPQMQIVQLQINYLDWDSPSLRARELYAVAARHGKEIVVMEPVKGGTLAMPSSPAAALLPKGASPTTWALRFAKGLEQVQVVLSGMSDLEQVRENLSDEGALLPEQEGALFAAAQVIRAQTAVPCTGCGYCEAGCPKNIAIPQIFAMYNEYCRNPKDDWKIRPGYQALCTQRAPAVECVQCGQCESVCPQKIDICAQLARAAQALG